MLIKSYAYVLTVILFVPWFVWAEQESDTPPKQQVFEAKWLQWVDKQHRYISDKVTATGVAVDEYVARESFDTTIPNKSYLRIRMGEQFTTDNQTGFKANVNARIDVPNTRGKVKLFFDSDPDDFESLDNKRAENKLFIDNSSTENKALAGVSFFIKEKSKWRPTINLGLKFKLPIDPYVKAMATRYIDLSGSWTSRFKQTFFYYRSDGLGSDTRYDMYRPIAYDKAFSSNSEIQYLDKKSEWELYQGFSFYKRVNKKNMLEHTVYVTVVDQKQLQVESYGLKTRWRRLLYKDWLFMNLSPDMRFPRTENFKATPGILIEFEVFFAKNMRSWI